MFIDSLDSHIRIIVVDQQKIEDSNGIIFGL